jgi:hypothetical protein
MGGEYRDRQCGACFYGSYEEYHEGRYRRVFLPKAVGCPTDDTAVTSGCSFRATTVIIDVLNRGRSGKYDIFDRRDAFQIPNSECLVNDGF